MYRYISDPGHGWLAVPVIEVSALNIEITAFSYVDRRNEFAYLEEDLDMSTFVNAKIKADDYQGTIQNWYDENVEQTIVNQTWIRGLPRYH